MATTTNAWERTYAHLVYLGRRTIDQVPTVYRAGCIAYLKEHYGVDVSTSTDTSTDNTSTSTDSSTTTSN